MTHGQGQASQQDGGQFIDELERIQDPRENSLCESSIRLVIFFYRSAHSLFLLVPCPSHAAGSPAGPTNTSPNGLATPKSGEPSSFQLTLSTLVYLLPSHAPFALAVAWYTFQISVPSGEVKKALCAVPRLPLADEKTGPDLVQESRTSGSAPSARVRSPSW